MARTNVHFMQTISLMTSSHGNIFRVTGLLCGELTGHRWIPYKKASDAELWCFLIIINGWVNNRAADLRRHRDHYDVTVSTLGAEQNHRHHLCKYTFKSWMLCFVTQNCVPGDLIGDKSRLFQAKELSSWLRKTNWYSEYHSTFTFFGVSFKLTSYF